MLLKVTDEYGKILIYNGKRCGIPRHHFEDSMARSCVLNTTEAISGFTHEVIMKGVDVKGYFAWSLLTISNEEGHFTF